MKNSHLPQSLVLLLRSLERVAQRSLLGKPLVVLGRWTGLLQGTAAITGNRGIENASTVASIFTGLFGPDYAGRSTRECRLNCDGIYL
jgi:hypothetical protein